ncbi:hypothetical protein DRF75_03115 [Ehrlichia minasensis]|uniref:Uncharacterized protein n=1 Tax=Ehrlichia minasensis TaxID=1242993 RepID=A0A4Q6I435_9RICK|nr:hypothetical protein [Ehrlichia minasensis]RZB12645.1 hypothetical protein DRF75_03115 [Ehrlichia minasensis]CEI84977.1 Uncharacterized protein ehr_00354 [Ehrlichia minasensis]
MLGKDYFTYIDRKLSSYAKLNNDHKLSSRYHFMLGSCILMTAIITVLSIIVLYSDRKLFLTIFRGEAKLFGGDNLPFSLALVVIIPAILLLFFLIYKVCETQEVKRKLNNKNVDVIGTLQEAYYALQRELDYNSSKIGELESTLEKFKIKYSNFVKQCSDEFVKVEEQCKSVLASVNSATCGVTSSITKVQHVVEDITLQLNGLCSDSQKLTESCDNLLLAIESTISSELIKVDDKVSMLRALQADLTADANLSIITSKARPFVDQVRNALVEKPSILKSAMLRDLWCLQESVNVSLTKAQKTDHATVEFMQLLQMMANDIGKFLCSSSRRIDGYSGSDKNMLEKLIRIELPLLQICVLRFLTVKRASRFADASTDIESFVQENLTSSLQKMSDSSSSSSSSTQLYPTLLLEDTNVSDQAHNNAQSQ